jgi:hypothetical protein
MRFIRASKGQSTAEYAVLFAIVIGAAIAMQQYVKSRLQGAVRQHADDFITAAGGGPFWPDQTTQSSSTTVASMSGTGAVTGTSSLTSDSSSTTTVTK